jgi:hypothetical protein
MTSSNSNAIVGSALNSVLSAKRGYEDLLKQVVRTGAVTTEVSEAMTMIRDYLDLASVSLTSLRTQDEAGQFFHTSSFSDVATVVVDALMEDFAIYDSEGDMQQSGGDVANALCARLEYLDERAKKREAIVSRLRGAHDQLGKAVRWISNPDNDMTVSGWRDELMEAITQLEDAETISRRVP